MSLNFVGSLCWPMAGWVVACVREVAGKTVRGVGVISQTSGAGDGFSFNAAIDWNV